MITILTYLAMAPLSIVGSNQPATTIPTFDTSSYCRGIEQSGDATVYSPQVACKVREDTMKPQIDEFWIALSESKRRDCVEMARYGGGSYVILFMCTTKELGLYGLRPDGSDPVIEFRRGKEGKQ